MLFVSLESEIFDLVESHYHQQVADFPGLKKDIGIKNSMGMASMDVLSSQTMHNDVMKRNAIQKDVGELSTFWNEVSIKDLRKQKKQERGSRSHW